MQRWREPAVLVVTVALLVRLVLVLVFTTTSTRLALGRPADLASLASQQLGEPAMFVVLALLAGSCWLRPVTSHARLLTGLALTVAAVVVLVSVVLGLAGDSAYTAPFTALNLGARLVDLVVPVLAVLALALLVTRPAEARPALAAGAAGAAEEVPEPRAEPEPAATDPELEPTWQPDVAAGAAWYSAGDAAAGRPAAGWGRSDASGGWQPAAVTTGPEPADPERGRAEPARSSSDEDDDEPEGWRPLP